MDIKASNLDFFRILLISDLHIRPDQKLPGGIDSKAKISNLDEALPDDINIFFDTLDKIFRDVPEVDLPRAVIVSGDLVDKGGLAEYKGKNEFDVAKEFLNRLANRLGIREEKIIVVPGNHDVDWSSGNPATDQKSRFDKYIKAVEDFKSPGFENDQLTPRKVQLKNIKHGCYDVEILLLVSPTYSGTANADNKKHMNKILGVLNLEDKEAEEQIRQKIEHQKDRLDIAAIGRHQRNYIRERSSDVDNTIRIAVMHHHLLPDPQLEIANFEAVIDSGKVLEDLVGYDFDLVLTGHKHNRKFMNISIDDTNKNLDVFSSPSLYQKGENCLPGFSIIEINTPSSPYYAQIHSYGTKDGRPTNESIQLERKSRVSPDLKKACAQIPYNVQENHLLPLANSIQEAFEWGGNDRFKALFDRVIRTIKDDLNKLANRTLVFRHPYLNSSWRELINLAHEPTGNNTLKLVSEEDVVFFRAGREDQEGEAARYSKPLKDFSGTKERAFIFNSLKYKSIEELRDIDHVINNMIDEDGFSKIYIVYKDRLPKEVERDFAIVGGFAVGRFDGSSRTGSRSLEESFSLEEIEKAESDWQLICSFAEWDSSQNIPFAKWLKDTVNKDINEAN